MRLGAETPSLATRAPRMSNDRGTRRSDMMLRKSTPGKEGRVSVVTILIIIILVLIVIYLVRRVL
jgi:hypothetical protein